MEKEKRLSQGPQIIAFNCKKLMEVMGEYKLRDKLMENCLEEASIILWREVNDVPEEGSYILIKYLDPSLKMVLCLTGAYENGAFFELPGENDKALNKRYIIGWSYFPYDERD